VENNKKTCQEIKLIKIIADASSKGVCRWVFAYSYFASDSVLTRFF